MKAIISSIKKNNKMKTLEEILARQDYKKVSGKLYNRCNELSLMMAEKMVELDATEVSGYRVATLGGTFEPVLLVWRADKWNSDLSGYVIMSEGKDECKHCCDYGNLLGANNAERIKFLRDAKQILSGIDELETAKTSEIQAALE